MSQDSTGFVAANNPGASFRAALNVSLAALATLSSGASAPTITYAYMLWADTTTGLLKQRDSLNANWIVLGPMGTAYFGLLQLAGGNMTGAINYARSTVASAASPDIWTGTGNNINFTGTAAVTGFAAAPQAGASRILDCAAACTFTAGANMVIDGVPSGSTITMAAGDRMGVYAQSTTVFKLQPILYSGSPVVAAAIQAAFKNLKIVASGLTNYTAALTADEATLENSSGQYVTSRNISVSPTINSSGANGLDNQAPQTCTIAIATSLVTLNNHGFPANAPVVFATTGALPTGLTAGATYYVIPVSANTFQVSATQGGAAVTMSGTQSGTQTVASAFAANCWYSVWVMFNGTTVSGLLSASQTNPVLPSGYTFKARLGWVRTDGTANKYLLQTFQYGRNWQYVVLGSSNVPNYPSVISGIQGNVSTPTYVAAALGAFLPPTASRFRGFTISSGGQVVMVSPNNQTGNYTSTANPPPFVSSNGASATHNELVDMLLESANVNYAASAAQCGLFCMGCEDNI